MLLERKEALAIANILAHGYYRKKLPVIVKYFGKSRNWLTRSDIFVNAFQAGIMNSLAEVQQTIQKGKQIIEAGATGKEKENLEKSLLMNRQIARVLQTIGDGIAWRSLRYQRPLLRLLSENKSAGPLTDHEIKTYKKVLQKSRYRIIINDLTRFLRIADITQIGKDGRVILLESKRRGKVINDAGTILNNLKRHKQVPSPQQLRHIVAQMSFVDNKISIPTFSSGKLNEVEYEIINADFSIETHHKRIKQMLKIANKKGFCVDSLEPGYFVNIVAYDRITNRKIFHERFERYKSESGKKREQCFTREHGKIISISSWDSFCEEDTHFPRNITPVSVLPFSNKDCARLMMGFLKIDISIDLDILTKKLRDNGWGAEINMKVSAKSPNPTEPFSTYIENSQATDQEGFLNLKKSDDKRILNISIPPTFLLIMLSSFYKTNFLTDKVANYFFTAAINNKIPKSKKFEVYLTGERSILK